MLGIKVELLKDMSIVMELRKLEYQTNEARRRLRKSLS
jgi:hypothetical protein